MSHLFLTISTVFILLLSGPFQALAGGITGKISVKGLRSPGNVVVYLTKAPGLSVDLSHTRFIMDQKNLAFVPHILPVMVGSTVHFPNDDKVAHNVFSLSRTKKFNLGSYKPGTTKTILFDKPGIVELRCDVHAEMGAYIMVMKNPYWALSDARGNFKIPDPAYLDQHGIKGVPDLPPGKYVIKTWHEKLKTAKKVVEVPAKGETTLRLDLRRGVPSVLYK